MKLDVTTQPEPHVAEHGSDADDCQLCETAKIATLKTRLATAREFAAQAELAYGEKYKDLIAAQEAVRAVWEEEYALVIAEHERTKNYLESVEKELRQSVIDYCRDHDTKKFDEHLSVRVAIKLDYEIETATAWAKTNAPYMLVADAKQFEGLVKTHTKAKAKEEVEDTLSRAERSLEASGLTFIKLDPAYSAVIASELPSLSSEGQAAE